MLVFWEHRLVLLATPKTGSTAIEVALEPLANMAIQRPPELKHTPAYRYHRFLGPYLRASSGVDFTVLAMIREPLDWLGSWYRYRQRDEEAVDPTKSTAGMSFDRFLNDYMRDPRPPHADVGSQARFLSGPNGALGVDRLFRYEEIGDFVQFLEDRLGCEIILPRLNVSPLAPMEAAPDTIARLRAHAAADFALHDSLRLAPA